MKRLTVLFLVFIAFFAGSPKAKYKKHSKIFGNCFIAHDGLRWGVIDKKGKIILPFGCDGIKAINDSVGIASVFVRHSSLNTSVPRYTYYGKYFFFSRNGRNDSLAKPFSLYMNGLADDYQVAHVISMGPEYFLPDVGGDSIATKSVRFWTYSKKRSRNLQK